MNLPSPIDEIATALFSAPKTTFRNRIRANPSFVKSILHLRDELEHHFVYVDAFDKKKWAIFGLKLIEDDSIERFQIEPDEGDLL